MFMERRNGVLSLEDNDSSNGDNGGFLFFCVAFKSATFPNRVRRKLEIVLVNPKEKRMS